MTKQVPRHFYRQAGVIPFRGRGCELRLLLITSMRRGRWIIPKGVIETGQSPEEAALMEAREEAGIAGRLLQPALGVYHHRKWGGRCEVTVFALEVTEVADRWPEAEARERAWFTLDEAASSLRPAALREMVKRLPSTIADGGAGGLRGGAPAPEHMLIRPEAPDDRAAVREINLKAFGQPGEADLVEALRSRAAVTLSLVAERLAWADRPARQETARVVGHALFTPATITTASGAVPAVALGPMAVLPAFQRGGIGSRLVERGLDLLREAGHGIVIVLGHPGYYPRFGFRPASTFGVRCTYDVPDDVFMMAELEVGTWPRTTGTARYQPEFDAV